MVYVLIFEKIKSIYKGFVRKVEGKILSQIIETILEPILELSKIVCQLDSSGSVHRHSDCTTVPE